MSLPVCTYYCDACDFSTMEPIGKLYYYQISTRDNAPIYNTAGWCYQCDSIVNIEYFPTLGSLDQESKEIRASITSLNQQLAKSQGLFSFLHKNKITSIQHVANQYKKELSENALLRCVLKKRKSPQRCLSCGSTDVENFGKNYIDSDKLPKKLDFIHPGCGGTFWVKNDGLRIAYKLIEKFYDLEGRHYAINEQS